MHKSYFPKDELAHLEMQIKRSNAKSSYAEKRLKINWSFEKAIQKCSLLVPPGQYLHLRAEYCQMTFLASQ